MEPPGRLTTATSPAIGSVKATAGGGSDPGQVQGRAGALASVQATPDQLKVKAGSTVTVQAQGVDAYGHEVPPLTCSGSTSIGTITPTPPNGDTASLYGGTKTGKGAVTVWTGDKSAEAPVTVNPGDGKRLKLSAGDASASATVLAGGSLPFKAIALDHYDNEIPDATFDWSASQEIGTIDASGVLHAATKVAAGTVSVTSNAVPGASTTVDVAVVPGPLTNLALTASSVILPAGERVTLTVVAHDPYGNPITNATIMWSATIGQVVALDDQGKEALYTAPADAGTARVTASSRSVSTSVDLEVIPASIENLSISPLSPHVVAGTTLRFVATATDAAGTSWTGVAATWTASSGLIAPDGTFTAPTTAGKAIISATAGGTRSEGDVIVVAGAVDRILVVPSSLLLPAGGPAA